MRAFLFPILFFFLLFVYKSGLAHYYKQYTTRDGFLSNDVYHVVKDKKGYLWFCTTKGVVKYNGIVYEKYTLSNGLTDNDIFDCFEDKQGRMWFFTYNGKYCYYKNDTIYNEANDPLLKKMSLSQFSYINTMYEDTEQNTLYIGHVSGEIIKIKDTTVETIKCRLDNYDKLRVIYKKGRNINIASLRKLMRLSGSSVVELSQKELHDSHLSNGHLITANNKGIQLYKDEKLIWQTISAEVGLSNIYHSYYDGKGHIFCGTRKGLIVYNITDNTRRHYFHNARITSTMEDIHGNYWFSSFGNGVFTLNSGELEDTRLIADIKNHDLVATQGGQIFLIKENTVEYLRPEKDHFMLQKIPVIFNSHIEPVLITDSSFYYYGLGPGDAFYAYNLLSGKITIPHNLYFNQAYRIDSNKFLFLNTLEIFAVQINGNRLLVLDHHKFKDRILSEYYDVKTKKLYFFSENILYGYDAVAMKTDTIDTVNAIGGNNTIFYEGGHLYAILNNNHLVIYTIGGQYKKTIPITLPAPVYGIIKIEQGKYIINTDMGYEILQIQTTPFAVVARKIVYPFEQKDILFLHFYHNRFICKIGEELYSFSPNVLNKNVYRPKLYLKKIVLNNRDYHTNNSRVTTSNNTEVKVVLSPVYFGGSNLTYRYRTSEADKTGDWHTTQTSELNFLFNSPGEYKIEMQAIASDRIISNTEMVAVTIRPSFFSSAPFYLACSLFLFLAGGMALRYKNKRRQKMFNNEMNYLQMEHKSINSLLNPHFIFNTINNIQGLINEDSKEQANEYLATLSIMIRQNIENLQHGFIPLDKELTLVQNYIALQNLRFSNAIGYSINNTITGDIFIPPLLIHTFVENAIVHGYSEKIKQFRIDLTIERLPDNYVKIIITDNGKGLNNSKGYTTAQKDKTSLGIAFTDKRLKRLSQFYKADYLLELHDLSQINRGTGTEVVIIIYSGFKNL